MSVYVVLDVGIRDRRRLLVCVAGLLESKEITLCEWRSWRCSLMVAVKKAKILTPETVV